MFNEINKLDLKIDICIFLVIENHKKTPKCSSESLNLHLSYLPLIVGPTQFFGINYKNTF